MTGNCGCATAKNVGVTALFRVSPLVSPLNFGEVTASESAKGVLEGVLGGVTGKNKDTMTVTHEGSRKRPRFRASCLVWRVIQASPSLVRMRFLFVFSSRIGHHRYPFTDVPIHHESPPNETIIHRIHPKTPPPHTPAHPPTTTTTTPQRNGTRQRTAPKARVHGPWISPVSSLYALPSHHATIRVV